MHELSDEEKEYYSLTERVFGKLAPFYDPLPFPDESFDISSISFALHDMPRSIRKETLKEMARVTKPDGMILIIDHALPENKLGRFLAYNFTRLHEAKYYREFIRSGLEPLLARAGLRIEAEKPVMCGTARIYRAVK